MLAVLLIILPQLTFALDRPAYTDSPISMLLADTCDDVLLLIAQRLISADDLAGALGLAATCTSMRHRLDAIRCQCEALQLTWLPEHTSGYKRAEPQTVGGGGSLGAWAACRPLPTSGCHSWDVAIDRCFMDRGCLVIGVCDEESTCGWGLMPANGEIWRQRRGASLGQLSRSGSAPPPPNGFPDGHEKKVTLSSWRCVAADG